MTGMGKESVGMKEDESERISEMDIDGLTEHNKQTPQRILTRTLSLSKGGRPPPCYRDWRGPQPSVFILPQPSVIVVRPRHPPP